MTNELVHVLKSSCREFGLIEGEIFHSLLLANREISGFLDTHNVSISNVFVGDIQRYHNKIIPLPAKAKALVRDQKDVYIIYCTINCLSPTQGLVYEGVQVLSPSDRDSVVPMILNHLSESSRLSSSDFSPNISTSALFRSSRIKRDMRIPS